MHALPNFPMPAEPAVNDKVDMMPRWTRAAAHAVRTRGCTVLGRIDPRVARAAIGPINAWIGRGMHGDPLGRAERLEERFSQIIEWPLRRAAYRLGLSADPGPGPGDAAARQLHRFDVGSYGDIGLRTEPELLAPHRLVEACVRDALGPDVFTEHANDMAQISLRFPGQQGPMHVDGFGNVRRGGAPALAHAVVGIYLSDVGPDDAPFEFWPAGLRLVSDWARARARAATSREVLHDARMAELKRILLAGGAGDKIVGPAGTVFICHGACPHRAGLNAGTGVRYVLFKRFYRPSDDAGRWSILTDPDRAWAGLSH